MGKYKRGGKVSDRNYGVGVCRWCGTAYVRQSSTSTLCSDDCRSAFRRAKRAGSPAAENGATNSSYIGIDGELNAEGRAAVAALIAKYPEGAVLEGYMEQPVGALVLDLGLQLVNPWWLRYPWGVGTGPNGERPGDPSTD